MTETDPKPTIGALRELMKLREEADQFDLTAQRTDEKAERFRMMAVEYRRRADELEARILGKGLDQQTNDSERDG